MEKEIDRLSAPLPELKNFILPGGHEASAQAHICRTLCRRVERACVALQEEEKIADFTLSFLNRLSDYFFVLARSINHQLGIPSPEWKAQ